jgi:hypothetical protein
MIVLMTQFVEKIMNFEKKNMIQYLRKLKFVINSENLLKMHKEVSKFVENVCDNPTSSSNNLMKI